MKNKIILLFLIIFFSVTILNLNEVFGVGLISQCWKQDINGDTKPDLVFRVFTAASDTTRDSHINNPSNNLVEGGIWKFTKGNSQYTSTWRDLTKTGNLNVNYIQFLTAQYAFHKEPMGNYETPGNSAGFSKTDLVLTDGIPSIEKSVKVAQHIKVIPKRNKDYNNDTYYNNNVFFKVDRITGSYSDVDYGTKKILTGYTFNKHTQYRETIVNIDGVNILITDHVIYNDDLIKLIAKAKESGQTDGCYVSQVLISASVYNVGGKLVSRPGVAEVARTLYDFIRFDDKSWHPYTTGTESASKGLGGGGNLYDNELIFPQMSKRTVLVRHINIGNNTTISTNIIKDRINNRIKSNNLTIKVGEATVNGRNTSNTYTGYEEYYEEIADVDKAITKEALQDTNTYKCIGYNVSEALSYDVAKQNIDQTISRGRYTSGNIVELPSKTESGDNSIAIIDFYYTEYEKDVTVNHYYTDRNGNVKALAEQTIEPNTTANDGTITRINNDRYIKEVYPKKFGQSIQVTTANSVSGNANVIYQGYQMFTQKDITDGKVVGIGDQGKYEKTGRAATLSGENVIVNFYYTIENTVELIEPEKDLDGQVFVKNKENVSATCTDTTESGEVYTKVTSIPSGSNAIVGIKEIPKYMVGAITSKYVSPAETTHKMNLTINLTMGKQVPKKLELKNIPYKVGYYKITDMAVYKLTSAKVYDAGASGVDTVGDGLFKWDKKNLALSNMGYTITMTGINGDEINPSEIDNINNYVTTQITGISPATNIAIQSTENSIDSTVVNIPYISEEEFNKVDANGDSQITENDKVYAEQKLQEYSDKLQAAKDDEIKYENEYNEAVRRRDELKTAYDNAEKKLGELSSEYSKQELERISRAGAIEIIRGEIKTLEEETMLTLNTELEKLQGEHTTLTEELLKLQGEHTTLTEELSKLQAENNALTEELSKLQGELAVLEKELEDLKQAYKKLEDELDKLTTREQTAKNAVESAKKTLNNIEEITKSSQEYASWQNSISERNRLEKAANCNDNVEEDIYINLEQDEKDALEQCAQAKAAYQKNIEDKVVEKAQERYLKYLEQQRKIAQDNLNEAVSDVEEIIESIQTKKQEISSKQSEIEAKEKEISSKQSEIESKQDEVDIKQSEIDSKQVEIDSKQVEIDSKQTEIDSKQAEIDSNQVEIDSKQNEIKEKEILLGIAERNYDSFMNDYWTPAKNEYFDYRDNADSEYNIAKNKYNEHVENEYVENAYDTWQKSIEDRKKSQSEYDIYKKYKETLEELYEPYKAMYDEFTSLTDKTAARILGLKLNITVQNMSVKFKAGKYEEQLLTESKTNSKTESYSVEGLQRIANEDEIPQVWTDPIKIEKKYYNNISYIGKDPQTISEKEYEADSNDYIDTEKLNGVRVLAGSVEYSPMTVIGDKKASEIEDNLYYNQENFKDGETNIFRLKSDKITKKYEINRNVTDYSQKYQDVEPVNIYTPITVSASLLSVENDIVDQRQNNAQGGSAIQLNTAFTIEIDNKSSEGKYKISDTSKYALGYYIKFDFEVHNVYINGKKYKNGDRISPDVWIGMFKKGKDGKTIVEAQAYGNIGEDGLDIISEDNGSYTVRAVAYNATTLMLNESIRYDALADMLKDESGIKNTVYNICTMKQPSYFAQTEINDLIIINRMFDFRITDVKDLNWKSVFRTTSGGTTNNHNGILYYSGTTKWNTKTDKSNEIIQRTTSEIGKSPFRTLPIGPYKSTEATYVKAPKIGYRFSFDLKVTGSYYDKKGNPRDNKRIEIATKFYYISKDGTEYLKEYDGESEGIYLFYKNSQGRYVRIDENGGGYNLTFTPDDGYRYLDDGDKSNLAKSVTKLGNLRSLTLTRNMATVAPNRAVITYYGEYKLPNSTIAVEVNKDKNGNISYDINKPLKNGYIGVIFDIVAYSGTSSANEVKLSYSKDTKQNTANTSQWDYEGFLGYTKYGNTITEPLSIKLEKGSWKIDNKTYNEIKGSVILYDLDERAADDYE